MSFEEARSAAEATRVAADNTTACEREPIHIPGAIQAHGALLAVRADTGLVSHASANLAALLGIEAIDAIGQPLEQLLGAHTSDSLLRSLPGRAVLTGAPPGSHLTVHGALLAQSHRSGAHVCIDIEQDDMARSGIAHAHAGHVDPVDRVDRRDAGPLASPSLLQIQAVLDSLEGTRSTEALCEAAVHGLRGLTGYDRVMAYRFGVNGDGDVIAEALADDQGSYLGLRYPASDIPPQARRQYLRQRVGAIADSSYRPVPLLADRLESAPLDLTHSHLRSVSPVHCEYMRNMKTAASLTIGLAHGPALWGMLVCHHRHPRVAGPGLRAAAGMIGKVVSFLIATLSDAARDTQHAERSAILNALVLSLSDALPLHDAIVQGERQLLLLANSSGALVRVGGRTTLLGHTPPPEIAEACLAALLGDRAAAEQGLDDFPWRHPQVRGCEKAGSGTLLMTLDAAAGDAVLWFRRELSSTVNWGGDPAHHVTSDHASGRLSPRKSFEAWQETVRGRSAPWTDADRVLARELGDAIFAERAIRTTRALRESEVRFQLLAEHSGVVVTLNDMSNTRQYVSPAAESVLGWRPEDMVGRKAIEFVHPDDRLAFEEAQAALLDGTAERSACYRYMRRDGSWLWVEGHARLRAGIDGSGPKDYVVVIRDATERKAAEMELVAALDRMEHMASIDGLTGLSNRRHFDLVADREWRRCERDQLPISVLLVDADHFKLFNDRYGHLAGDECLRALAEQLQMLARRPGDLAARFGGEEFLLLLPNTGLKGAVRVAEQLLALVDGLAIPHESNVDAKTMSVSIGVARAWPGRQDGYPDSLDTLLLDADAALYRAKSGGRNRVASAPGGLDASSVFGDLLDVIPFPQAPVPFEAPPLAPLAPSVGTHEALMQFLYRAPIGLVQTTIDGSIEMMNPVSASLLMPLSKDGNLDNFFVALDSVAPQFREWTAAFESTTGPICDSVRIWISGGSPGDVAAQVLCISILKLDDQRLMATVSDATQDVLREQHGVTRRLNAASRVDLVTKLPNRAAMRDLIALTMETAQTDAGFEFAVFFLNCDRFRQINDAFGPDAGNEMLAMVAERLRSTLQQLHRSTRSHAIEQLAARVGGDEFVVLLDELHQPEDAVVFAGQLLAALREPYDLNDRHLQCSFSMGIVLRAEAGPTADAVLQNASIAMVVAKGAGGDGFVLFEPSMHERAAQHGSVESDLRRALAEDQLYVVYQPVVALQVVAANHRAAARCVGVEALVRWNHPTRGVVPPLEFIGVAERCGLIGAIGSFVLECACRQFMAWKTTQPDLAPALLAVNLSRAQLSEPGFVAAVAAILRATALPPECLQLEVTESLAAQDETVQARLHELKALGLTLALDDFGTGYSSLASLHQLPVDTVKIDRSFVSEAVTSNHHRVLIEATIRVANSLEMHTVAEGIETEAQADLLRQLGCDTGQGYLFSKPLAAVELTAWLNATASVVAAPLSALA